MTTAARKQAFRILEFGFYYLRPHPLHFDPESGILQYTNPKKSRNSFTVFLLLNALISAGSAYDVFTHFFIWHRENYNMGFAGLHIIVVVATSAPLICSSIFKSHPDVTKGITALLEFQNIHRTSKFIFQILYISLRYMY